MIRMGAWLVLGKHERLRDKRNLAVIAEVAVATLDQPPHPSREQR